MNSKGVLIIYASVYGHAERIATRIADAAREWGIESEIKDVRDARSADLAQPDVLLLVASVHFGKHPRSITRFVKANRARLDRMHGAFISVSGDAAEQKTRPRADGYVRSFFRDTGWTAEETLLAGGAVTFSRYNFALRWIMKRLLAAKGIEADPHRDYEHTDWEEVLRFAKAFLTSRVVKAA